MKYFPFDRIFICHIFLTFMNKKSALITYTYMPNWIHWSSSPMMLCSCCVISDMNMHHQINKELYDYHVHIFDHKILQNLIIGEFWMKIKISLLIYIVTSPYVLDWVTYNLWLFMKHLYVHRYIFCWFILWYRQKMQPLIFTNSSDYHFAALSNSI